MAVAEAPPSHHRPPAFAPVAPKGSLNLEGSCGPTRYQQAALTRDPTVVGSARFPAAHRYLADWGPAPACSGSGGPFEGRALPISRCQADGTATATTGSVSAAVTAHLADHPPLVRRHRLHREPRVLHQHHFGEPRIGLDRLEAHRPRERRHRPDVDADPLRVVAGRVRVRLGDRPRPRRPPPSRRRSDRRSPGRPSPSPSCGCAPGSCAPRPIPGRRRPWRPGRPSSRSPPRT